MISSQVKTASLPLEAREIKEGVKIEYKSLFLRINIDNILDSEENASLMDWKISEITSEFDDDENNNVISLNLHFKPK